MYRVPKKCPKSALQTKAAKFDTFWFEYHEPHNPNYFFFTYKGVRGILSAISSSENDQNLTFCDQILVKYIHIQVFWQLTISTSSFYVFTSSCLLYMASTKIMQMLQKVKVKTIKKIIYLNKSVEEHKIFVKSLYQVKCLMLKSQYQSNIMLYRPQQKLFPWPYSSHTLHCVNTLHCLNMVPTPAPAEHLATCSLLSSG